MPSGPGTPARDTKTHERSLFSRASNAIPQEEKEMRMIDNLE